MQDGIIEPLSEEIVGLGLQTSNSITLLGCNIKNTGCCFEDNIQLIIQRVQKQANIWSRFNLSLPGRISVAKSFMYSQINYLGCFMPISDIGIERISLIIEKFVRGNLKIGRKKFYEDVKNGGMGLFKIRDFLSSQCCAWARRAINLDDLWKKELFGGSYGNIFNLRKKNFNKDTNPILHYIASCMEKLLINFTVKNENFLNAWIYENPCISFDVNNRGYLTTGFFSALEFATYKLQIYSLKVSCLLTRNLEPIEKNTFEQNTGIILSLGKFLTLRGCAITAMRKYTKLDRNEKRTDYLQNFCMRIRRGSKLYRGVLCPKSAEFVPVNIVNFALICETTVNLEKSIRMNGLWNVNFFDNSTRTF